MTPDQRFTLIISGLGLLFTIMCVILGVALRAAIKFTRSEDKIADVAEDVKALVADKERAHMQLWSEMKDQNNATDRRLRWLEEHLWSRQSREQHP